MDQKTPSIDPRNGFNSATKVFHSLRPPIDLPPENVPLSASSYALSLRRNFRWPDYTLALINSATGQCVSYSEFAHRTNTLAANLQSTFGLSKGDTAFVLSPNSTWIPILYFSLLTLGVVISPANPVSTDSEILRLIELCKPVIAFSMSTTAHKLPKVIRTKTILIDSPEFDCMTTSSTRELEPVEVRQSDLAAILYSSGTTGMVKGVMTTHRNLIATIAGYHSPRTKKRESPAVFVYTAPYFHALGFFYSAKSVSVGDTVVVMEKFDLRKMLGAVEEFRVTDLILVPPVVVAMVKAQHLTASYDLSSLEQVTCGGAPLGKDVIKAFKAKFRDVVLAQGYGMTEVTGGGVFRAVEPQETQRLGSTGRLSGGFEAKVVDPDTGEALSPCQHGELWVRGPSVMKGYIGDPEATSATLVTGGWLRTGDICYIDEDGFLYVVDRLKELIKYKGYQVAPAELEQLLQSHSEIVDAAVIPYPDEEAGQLPMAVVVRHPKSTLGEAEVIQFVGKQVAPFKKVRRVVFVESIPKSASGKILRKELRKIFIPGSFSKL